MSPASAMPLPRRRYYDHGLLRQLTNELERHYELPGLLELCAVQLNMLPETLGATNSKAAFARAMVEACVEDDSVWALLDALRQHHGALHPLLQLHISAGVAGAPALEKGDELGEYLLLKELDRDELAAHFWARKGGEDYRLQVLGYHASIDSARLQRLQLVLRRISELKHAGIEQSPSLERLDGMYAVVSRFQKGQRLSDRIMHGGNMSFGTARKLFRRLLEPLSALHSVGLVHGQLCARNVLLPADDPSKESLVLLGGGRNWLWDGTLAHAPTIAMAPELLKGGEPTPASDVYSFAALVYELIAGRPVFAASSPQELATLHLSATPPPLTSLRGSRSVPATLDLLFTRCLSKQPSERPQDASELLRHLQQMGSVSMHPQAALEPGEVEARAEALRKEPGDRKLLAELVDAISQGAEPRLVGDELWKIAHDLNEPEELEARCRLLEETAQVYSGAADHPTGAQAAYEAVLESNPGDAAIVTPLIQLYADSGEFDALVRLVDVQAPEIEEGSARAKAYARAAQVLEVKVNNPAEALVRYVHAFCEHSEEVSYSSGVERLAPQLAGGWERVIEQCLKFTMPHPNTEMTPTRLSVLNRLARWYDKLGQTQASEDCYRAVLNATPDNRPAFDGLTSVLRRAERWHELAQALTDFASAPETPPVEARDLLADAATVYAEKIGAREAAAHLLQRVVDIDPGHDAACELLLGQYEASGDWPRYAELLEQRGRASRGERCYQLLSQAAQIFHHKVGDEESALELYREALALVPTQADALDGLSEILTHSGRFQELLDTLIGHLDVVSTGRQKAQIWGRIAVLYEQEYLDQQAAINAYQQVVALSPQQEEGLVSLARLYAAVEDWASLAQTYGELLTLREGQANHLVTALALVELYATQADDALQAAALLEDLVLTYPKESSVLEKLAEVRMESGDLDGGLLLFDDLAEQIVDSGERATHFYSVGRLLERSGYIEEAIERYKFAVDENPRARAFANTLREAYEHVGDYSAVYELMRGELRFASGAMAQAKIYGELARLAFERLGDEGRAEEMAIRADSLDPSGVDANYVRGMIAYKQERYAEVAAHFQRLTGHFQRLGTSGIDVWVKYATALARCGREEQALQVAEELYASNSEDIMVLRCAAALVFEYGESERSLVLHRNLVLKQTRADPVLERAENLFRLGTSAAQSGFYTEAIAALQDSLIVNSSQPDVLEVLSHCFEHEQMWQEAADTYYSALEFAEGDRRYELLVALGDLAHDKLSESEYAAQNYLLAHKEWPHERRVLVKLLQVYSELERWKSVVAVIMKLIALIEEPAERVPYLRVASMVCSRKLNDVKRGNELLDQALAYAPEQEELLDSALKLSRATGDGRRLAEMLKREIRIASKRHDKGRMMAALGELADVYLNTLGRVHQAIAVHEGALELDPDNQALEEYLTQAYTAHSDKYLEKAVALNQKALDRDPLRGESLRALRQLYTQARNADAAWCACCVLSVLQLASQEEIAFFERLRSHQVAIVRDGLQPGEWTKLLMHPDCEGPLTAMLVVIQPAVFAASAVGHGERWLSDVDRLNPIGHPAPILSALAYIADVLGVNVPAVVVDLRSEEALSFVPGKRSVFVAGQAGLDPQHDLPMAAFKAARSITRVLPGLGLHPLLGSSGELKIWVFAGIRLIHPNFGIPSDLAEDVTTAVAWLQEQLTASQVEQLAWLANQLLRKSTALDLKRWSAAVDKTMDRLALLFSDDLDVVVQGIRDTAGGFSVATVDERLAAICRYTVSEDYFAVRKRLGIRVQ